VLVFTNTPVAADLPRAIVNAARASWLGETTSPASDESVAIAWAAATPLTEKAAAELAGVYRNEYLIALAWRDGTLKFHVEDADGGKPGPWMEMRHVSGDQYVLAEAPGPYGTAVALVRGPDGRVTHLTHGRRAYARLDGTESPAVKIK
jgi:hypothetical protein